MDTSSVPLVSGLEDFMCGEVKLTYAGGEDGARTDTECSHK